MKKFILIISALSFLPISFAQNIWEKVNSPSRDEVQCMTISSNGKIFIADNTSGIHRSDDEGITWENIFSSGIYSILYRELLIGDDNNLYVAGRNHLLVMNQIGHSVYSKYFNTDVYSIALNSQLHLYVATEDSGIARSRNFGESWEVNILYPDSNFHFTAVAIDDYDNIYVGSYNGAFKSTDNGISWNSINSGLSDLYVFDIMCTSNGDLFLTSNYGISRSANNGENWEYVNNGIPANTHIRKIEEDNISNIYFGDQNPFGKGLIYKSSNWGEDWASIFQTNAGGIASIAVQTDYLLAGSFKSGLFRATLTDSSLTSISINPITVQHFAQNHLGELYSCGNIASSPVRVSTDSGNTWRVIEPTWLIPPTMGFWYKSDSLLFIGTSGEVGLIKNKKIKYYWKLGIDDCGQTTSVLYEPDSNYVFTTTIWSLNNCYGGLYRGKLDTNTNNWSKITNGLPQYGEFTSAEISSTKKIFVGVDNLGVYRSEDLGLTWESTNSGLNDLSIRIIKIDKTDNIYVCTYQNIFKSPDDGANWYHIADFYVKGFATDNDNNLYIGIYNQVYKSTDQGDTWNEFGNEFLNFTIRGLFLNDSSHLFVYGYKGIYRSIDPVTEVENFYNFKKLDKYSLLHNFPNPFNSTTKIKYNIPDFSFVTIKVYDVLGNEVAMIVNEENPSGSYEIEFDGSELTSGVYFYRLQSGSFVETKKMVLLK